MTTITQEWILSHVNIDKNNLIKVKSLNLPGSYIIGTKIKCLGFSLINFCNLKSLDISRNAIQELTGLNHLQNLMKLNIFYYILKKRYYNCIDSVDEIKRLRYNTLLEDVDIRLNPISRNQTIQYRFVLINILPNLQKLDDRLISQREKNLALQEKDKLNLKIENEIKLEIPKKPTYQSRINQVNELSKPRTAYSKYETMAFWKNNHKNFDTISLKETVVPSASIFTDKPELEKTYCASSLSTTDKTNETLKENYKYVYKTYKEKLNCQHNLEEKKITQNQKPSYMKEVENSRNYKAKAYITRHSNPVQNWVLNSKKVTNGHTKIEKNVHTKETSHTDKFEDKKVINILSTIKLYVNVPYKIENILKEKINEIIECTECIPRAQSEKSCQAELKKVENMDKFKEMTKIIKESHSALMNTNDKLLNELNQTKKRHEHEVRQLNWTFENMIKLPSNIQESGKSKGTNLKNKKYKPYRKVQDSDNSSDTLKKVLYSRNILSYSSPSISSSDTESKLNYKSKYDTKNHNLKYKFEKSKKLNGFSYKSTDRDMYTSCSNLKEKYKPFAPSNYSMRTSSISNIYN
ncbi:hypothetical protein A3Q56_00254 [Intoshia linei]|uniref:Centrosomal protein of 72 kDa n=1 Tax=Intoshia linei TaxID=1819745 RepID=A0A177BE31_9BILA|nr:hypothetical protein A3Q56_00254 [Intoshia linei]